MSWEVRLRPAAEKDLRDARDWYGRQRDGLGYEFLSRVATVISWLGEQPERFPEYYLGFRRALVPRFPYKVFFKVEADAVMVFRVVHSARRHEPVLDEESS